MGLHGCPSPSAGLPRPVDLSTEPLGSPSPSARRSHPVDLSTKKVLVTVRKGDGSERKYFLDLIKEKEEESGEESGTERPLPHVVKYHDLLEKIWGWDRLLQLGPTVTLSVYTEYLEEYHRKYLHRLKVHGATTDTNLSVPAGTCIKNEEQLVSELIARVKPDQKSSLLTWRSIILSCLIQKCPSVNHPAGCKLSDLSGAALLCIAKEAELTCKLLRLEAPIDDGLITQSTTIRLCALSLMNYTPDNSVSASAVMLGMAKEAEMMCSWMHKKEERINLFVDPTPIEMWDCNNIRRRMLDFMVNNILRNSSAAEHKTVEEEPSAEHKTVKEELARSGPAGDGDNIAADEAANTIGVSQYDKAGEKIKQWKSGEKGNKRKRKEEDVFGKIWCWERLVMPPDNSVNSSDYRSYLDKYYESNAHGFVAAAAAAASSKISQDVHMGHAIAKFCLKMEEELLSVWNTRVEPRYGDPLAVNTIMESSLIKEHALLSTSRYGGACCFEPQCYSTVVEMDLPSAIAFLCITKEAELMCELLKHGAKPCSQLIQLSSVIRLCALGLLLKGQPSAASAAAMLGMANEAKEMCDWMKRENRLVTLSLSESRGLEVPHLIRINAFDVMTSMLVDSSFLS